MALLALVGCRPIWTKLRLLKGSAKIGATPFRFGVKAQSNLIRPQTAGLKIAEMVHLGNGFQKVDDIYQRPLNIGRAKEEKSERADQWVAPKRAMAVPLCDEALSYTAQQAQPSAPKNPLRSAMGNFEVQALA